MHTRFPSLNTVAILLFCAYGMNSCQVINEICNIFGQIWQNSMTDFSHHICIGIIMDYKFNCIVTSFPCRVLPGTLLPAPSSIWE